MVGETRGHLSTYLESRRFSMNNLDHLLERNKGFAIQQSAEGTLMPTLPRAMQCKGGNHRLR
jgi:hypothetical protein